MYASIFLKKKNNNNNSNNQISLMCKSIKKFGLSYHTLKKIIIKKSQSPKKK